MTKRIAAVVVLLVAGLPCLAASHARSVEAKNQFHFRPVGVQAKYANRLQAEWARVQPRNASRVSGAAAAAQILPGRRTKAHPNANPPTTNVGFITAAQVPAGGAMLTNPALSGDFNGDGKADLLTVVKNTGGGSVTYSVAVALGNGDGTFQAPVLTAVPSNSSDEFAVGDLNGDGKEDVVIVHQQGSLAPGAPSSFDVMISNGDGTFTAGNNYIITANTLAGGILYDAGNTGKLAVVAVDAANPGNVWTLTGNGDGTFNAATSVTLGGRAGANLVFGDFNGDGLLDFADNDFATGELTVYLATSATAYATGVLYTTSDGVYDAYANAVGDLTGDGKPEIVSVNLKDSTVTIFVNNGDGTFKTGAYSNVAMAPSSGSLPFTGSTALTIADMNGDGKADVIVTNDFTADVTVLLGKGDGTVQVPSEGFATGGYPLTSALVGDFNGDGLADVVVTDQVYSFSYMKGYGDGTFRAATNFYTPTSDSNQVSPPQGWDIATGDLNGDGIPDVVIGNWCCDATVGISVFLSQGDGTLKPGVNYGSGGDLGFVAVADFNQDQKLDIAAVDNANGLVQLFTGNGDGTFTTGASLNTGDTDSRTVAAADLNGDGFPDLVVANNNGANFGVFLNDKTGAFPASPTTYPVSFAAAVVAVADVNKDGKADVIVPIPACACVGIFLGNGDGTFQPEVDYPVGNNPSHVAIGDLNKDGNPDLAVTINDPVGMGVVVLLGNGDGTFQAPNAVAYATSLQPTFLYNPFPNYVSMTDLDGDGNPDLVYTNTQYGTVGILYGKGDGTFFDPVEFATAGYSVGLGLADVNNDGKADVVTAGTGANGSSEATVLISNSGTGALPDYGIAANPSSATVSAGGTGSYPITLTPRNFYNGAVTFTCGTLPQKTTCSFSNPTLTPNGNPPMTTTLSLITMAPSSAALMVPADLNLHQGTVLLATLSGMGLFGLLLAGDWKKKRSRRMSIVLGVMVLALMFIIMGCGGGGNTIVTPPIIPGTPTGNYTVVVTATGTAGTNGGNTGAHTLNVTLIVQ